MGEETVEFHGRKRLLLRSVLPEQEALFAGKARKQVFFQFVPCVLCRLVGFVLLEKLVFGIVDVMEKIFDDFHFISPLQITICIFLG